MEKEVIVLLPGDDFHLKVNEFVRVSVTIEKIPSPIISDVKK